eukprot:TRINITY_DN90407_c0_g1_i1.p1 TRINITY_DN90407_c0_g1~~TRINITY_DN90407_c0_g1_i1.p1  ORF type:complete len:377 (+),score=183.66 TRINITY_DN90407_c0_g1_i1:130-1260(+)
MAPKRGAAAQGGRAAKKAAVDPFEEAMGSFLSVLDSAESLSDSEKQLLVAGAPHCLRTPSAERHAFQRQMVDMLQELLKGAQSKEEKQVEAAEAEVATCSASVETENQKLEGVAATAESAKTSAEAAAKAAEDASAALGKAKEALQSEQEKEKNSLAGHEKLLETKKEREALLAETWEKLKTEANWGKQWRHRDKMVEAVIEVLTEVAAEESLTYCLPVAMRTKPDDRGHFAKQTIEHCEAHLKKSLDALDAKVKGHDGDVEALKAAIAAAEEALKGAEEELQKKQGEQIATDNAAMEAAEVKKAAESVHMEAEEKLKELNKTLTRARDCATSLAAVLQRFHGVVDGGAAGAAVAEVAADAAAAAGNEAAASQDVG